MRQDNLKKSIILMGPTGIGKTFLGEHLSKKLNMPIISLDQIYWQTLNILQYENSTFLLRCFSTGKLKSFVTKKRIEKLAKDENKRIYKTKYKKTNPEVYSLIKANVRKFIFDMNRLCDMFNNLSCFRDVVANDYKYRIVRSKMSDAARMMCWGYLYSEILNIVLSHIDEPVIIDPPAVFGTIVDFKNITDEDKKTLASIYGEETNLKNLTDSHAKVISKFGTRVLFMPGDDYYIRSKELFKSEFNTKILQDLDAKKQVSNLVIIVNNLFSDVHNKAFKTRKISDVLDQETKKQLVNHDVVDRICSRITKFYQNQAIKSITDADKERGEE